jgi:redox-regulated HSP33 family molecular chaperone
MLGTRRTNLHVYSTENTQNTRKVKYLEEFDTKIKNILGHLSGAQMGLFGQIPLNQQISCKCTFKKFQREHFVDELSEVKSRDTVPTQIFLVAYILRASYTIEFF